MPKLSSKLRDLVDEENWIHASLMIEVQGNDEAHVKGSLDAMVERLKKEQGVQVSDVALDGPKELKEKWYSLIGEVDIVAKDFGRLIHIALLYSPASVEIFDTKEIKIPVGDAQNLLVDISQLVTSLAHTVFAQRGIIEGANKPSEKVSAPRKSKRSSKK